MNIENLKLKSQPKGTMAKWKSAKLIEHKTTVTKVTQTCTENDAVALLQSFLNLNIVRKDENHYHSAQLLIHMYIRNYFALVYTYFCLWSVLPAQYCQKFI